MSRQSFLIYPFIDSIPLDAEICTYLGIKRGTVYKWISEKAEDAVEGLREKSEDLKKKVKKVIKDKTP